MDVALKTLLHWLLAVPLLADSYRNFHCADVFLRLVSIHGDDGAHSPLDFVNTRNVSWLQWADFSTSFHGHIVNRLVGACHNVFEDAIGQRNLPHHYSDPRLDSTNIDENCQIIIMQ